MAEALQRLGPSLELAPMQQSAFVKPHSIMFSLDGALARWMALAVKAAGPWLVWMWLGSGAPDRTLPPPLPCSRILSSFLAGKQRRWDMVESHPSVAALLYHRTRQAVLLVRQVWREAGWVGSG